MTTHYEFLGMLHQELQPRGYLEIGVQTGASLALASCPAIGVDPSPLRAARANEQIFTMTSDEFFEEPLRVPGPIDLVYIDGMHLFEFALRDFLGSLRYANEDTVIVFDDVLPYNAAIAAREQPPGDWAGDVWKVIEILRWNTSVSMCYVDVWPTGALVVWDLFKYPIDLNYETIVSTWIDQPVPSWILDRESADTVEETLRELRSR